MRPSGSPMVIPTGPSSMRLRNRASLAMRASRAWLRWVVSSITAPRPTTWLPTRTGKKFSEHLLGAATDVLGGRHAVHFRKSRVDPSKAQVAVDECKPDRRTLEDGVEQRVGFPLAGERGSDFLVRHSAGRHIGEEDSDVALL